MPAAISSRKIPDEAHDTLRAFADEGIRCFAFTPKGGWVVVSARNRRFASGIPKDCFEKIKQLQGAGHQIQWVAVSPESGNSWSVITDRTFFNLGVPTPCHEAMVRIGREQVRKVVFHPRNPDCWVVFGADDIFSRGLPSAAVDSIRSIHGSARRVHHVALGTGGRWVVLADDRFVSGGIDHELLSFLRPFNEDKQRVDLLAFDPDGNGWTCVVGAQTPERTFATDLVGKGTSLWDEMEVRHVPGVSIAVVEDNRMSWAAGHGHLRSDRPARVRPDTIFQAASISKPITALGALRMVADGVWGLDDDVGSHLHGWRPGAAGDIVVTGPTTVRQLLAHSGGANVGGFSGYPASTQVLPTTVQILRGQPPATNAPVRIEYDPGTTAQYSGGGYTMLEQAMSQAARVDFAQLMRDRVLGPLRMDDSFFGPSVPSGVASRVASGHRGSSGRLAGGRRLYPERAAAGLYSTALDLTRVIIMMNARGRTEDGIFFQSDDLGNGLVQDEILRPQHRFRVNRDVMGLGFRLRNSRPSRSGDPRDNFSYHHGGSNTGFKSYFRGYPRLGAGVVVMTNGNQWRLTVDIASAVARVQGWEDPGPA